MSDTMSREFGNQAPFTHSQRAVARPNPRILADLARAKVIASADGSNSPMPRRSNNEGPLVWGSIPPRIPDFTGRRELLEQLDERLGAGATAVLPVALRDIGEIGKSQIAVEYIYQPLLDYVVTQWIQATQPTDFHAPLISDEHLPPVGVRTESFRRPGAKCYAPSALPSRHRPVLGTSLQEGISSPESLAWDMNPIGKKTGPYAGSKRSLNSKGEDLEHNRLYIDSLASLPKPKQGFQP
ncbi:hypothetical protein AB0M80_41405 [Amycolatopsis sp. NPDC051045]|uniref:hypothetical protein n=1 Tax=Amycolatopsis sp. NPDC051045 TaxID=3156922 RepID=UPI003438A047